MSNKLVEPIEGYSIDVIDKSNPGIHRLIKVIKLRLSKVGGAHIINPGDLIMQIEDAVSSNEEK